MNDKRIFLANTKKIFFANTCNIFFANIPRARIPYPHLATSEPPAAAHGHATIMLLDTNKPHHLACSGVPSANIA